MGHLLEEDVELVVARAGAAYEAFTRPAPAP
jgi:hypothetical protein